MYYTCKSDYQGYCRVHHRSVETAVAHSERLNAQVAPPAYLDYRPEIVGTTGRRPLTQAEWDEVLAASA